jgi:hypothetical protein
MIAFINYVCHALRSHWRRGARRTRSGSSA